MDPPSDVPADEPPHHEGTGPASEAVASTGAAASTGEEAEPSGPAAHPLRRNEDPLIPEVFRNTIPPPPPGWSEEDWRRSFLGDHPFAPGRTSGLSFGKGWLLAVVFAVVAVALIVFIIIVR